MLIPSVSVQWLFNVCYAVIGADLAAFVKTHVHDRHRELAERRDLNIAIDPEVLAAPAAHKRISEVDRSFESGIKDLITTPRASELIDETELPLNFDGVHHRAHGVSRPAARELGPGCASRG